MGSSRVKTQQTFLSQSSSFPNGGQATAGQDPFRFHPNFPFVSPTFGIEVLPCEVSPLC